MIAFLNGDYRPLESVCISPLDRGFMFGDGVYEVIPSYRGVLFEVDAHLDRLRRSLAAIRIADPLTGDAWRKMLERLLSLNPGADRAIYLQVTRGVAARDHAFPQTPSATVFAMVNPIRPPAPELAGRGVGAITLPDQRWGRCDIKTVTLLPNVLARQQAAEQGAVEAILLRQGKVTEGAASNVFVVRDGHVLTPPLSDAILPGITRRVLIDVLRGTRWPCDEQPVSEDELRGADEIWLTSSTKELLPVTSLDGKAVGDGHPGEAWHEALAAYQRVKPAGPSAASREEGI
ncbi:D-alanine aminotransferase [Thioalkalivibrio nitratireducens DSM 14787]|uniref:Aminodeoxychorismate lyase n=1 Tax=Thioalkalivibrio nitratireducens (strain DSM 14787 / UNIQEM 213 / ALEN2) TaxID=1255043 RepID=L0DY06_THIND|nr:D-amino acid aminotransferase [Thioalkalivibrio nitratireducens]AGA33855.1 D-alanine aminotransferase [Thioalkalivibrio nitratireducens DSM 14787]